jgi:hypothetical protein
LPAHVVPLTNWRIVVISFVPSKTLGRLMLISAGILLHATGVPAAELAGSGQMQASDLLGGTAGGRAKVVDAVLADDRSASYPDPHLQARQLILGGSEVARTADRAVGFDSKAQVTTVALTQDTSRVDTDGQESARRLLLGAGGV